MKPCEANKVIVCRRRLRMVKCGQVAVHFFTTSAALWMLPRAAQMIRRPLWYISCSHSKHQAVKDECR